MRKKKIINNKNFTNFKSSIAAAIYRLLDELNIKVRD